jgi:hypothetical protein
MKSFLHVHLVRYLLFSIVSLAAVSLSEACTVFILTDGKHTYFFNNEDFTNAKTRLWFVPQGKGYFGAAYIGFDDGEAQGGFNTEGLAFEWVTVEQDSYTSDPNYVPANTLTRLDVNTSQWMLERCRTVDEAISFYQTYREPAFAASTLIIADKSGASVIIGSKDGKIYFNKSTASRGMGYGEETFKKLHKEDGTIDLLKGAEILKQCVVHGDGGTKYSNSYDLKTGDISFYDFDNAKVTKLKLSEELKKGGHYYETSQISLQKEQQLRPLMLNMNRHIFTINQPLADQAPDITAKIKNLFSDVANGKLKYDDVTDNFANDLRKAEDKIKSVYGRFGNLTSLTLVSREKKQEITDYSYVIKFEKVTILWQFLITDENKINDFNTLGVFWIR